MTRAVVRVIGTLVCLTWSSAVVGVTRMQGPVRRCSVCDEGEEH